MAWGVTFTIRGADTTTELGWWLFVQEPASSIYEPVIHGTMWRSVGEFGVVGFMTLFISPFIFAYFTAWQWTRPRTTDCVQLANCQMQLSSILWAIGVCCLFLGISGWLHSGVVIVTPIVLVAVGLMIRPLRWWASEIQRRGRDKRMAEIRRRLQWRNVRH